MPRADGFAVLDYMNKINAVSVGFGLPTDEFFAE